MRFKLPSLYGVPKEFTLEIRNLIFVNNEHTELIKDYIEGKGGMAKIEEVHGVSSGTVHNHIRKHNKELADNREV